MSNAVFCKMQPKIAFSYARRHLCSLPLEKITAQIILQVKTTRPRVNSHVYIYIPRKQRDMKNVTRKNEQICLYAIPEQETDAENKSDKSSHLYSGIDDFGKRTISYHK
jgi:hypothetical protein